MTTIPASRLRHAGVWLLFTCAGVPSLSGCAATFPSQIAARPMVFSATPATVFVADGAGDYRMASRAIRQVLAIDGYPIDVITYPWSHGRHRILADQLDYCHARAEGRKLAATVLACHAADPSKPIFLVGHSAGATAIMVALESLPPHVVERAVLLSPSLSTEYDVRPALCAVKSLHVFSSTHDYWFLNLATCIIGTADRRWSPTAGRFGFQPLPESEDCTLRAKLVQHPWQPADRELGNNGGHYGNYQPEFLRHRIFPLFDPTR